MAHAQIILWHLCSMPKDHLSNPSPGYYSFTSRINGCNLLFPGWEMDACSCHGVGVRLNTLVVVLLDGVVFWVLGLTKQEHMSSYWMYSYLRSIARTQRKYIHVVPTQKYKYQEVPEYQLTIQYMAALYASVQIKACFDHRRKMSHCVSLLGAARLTD
jgi:hypothetical protein